MKKLNIRKKLLALLMSGNILLTGCSISGEITSKDKQNSDSTYTQSSFDENTIISEDSYEDNLNVDNSLNQNYHNEQISIEAKEESIEVDESSIEEESEEVSIEEKTESSTDEESIELVEEMSESDSSTEEELEDSNNEVYTDDNTYIRAKTNVNVRSEPNTDSNILSLLHEGNILKKMGYIDDWYIVEYDGEKAYVSTYYTDEIDEDKINTYLNESNICYFPYGTTLYSDKDLTNKLSDIPSLESGQILYQEGNTYFVDTSGYNGYVHISSVSIIPQPVIIVDKSEQTLRLYKDNSKIMEFPVVTGNESSDFYHPSDEGLFNIYSKSYDAELVGDTWDVVVNVFMGYNGGEGIHDAVWRADYEFGGTTYQWNGSHGCINCPYDEVMNLSNEVEVGDKVLVKR